MNGTELFRAGKLKEAIQATGEDLRQNPLDGKLRTFLFELLCFSGEYERAEKQLNLLSEGGRSSELGALLYRSALHAEAEREDLFVRKAYMERGATPSPQSPGTLDGRRFHSISDADPRIGARLEVFLAGAYMLVPFEHIASIEMQSPRRLRDLLWAPVIIRTGPSFAGRELGEVLAPVLCPMSSRHPDEDVRLGRITLWETDDAGVEAPFGQKLLLVDGEEVPILELRKLEFTPAAAAAS